MRLIKQTEENWENILVRVELSIGEIAILYAAMFNVSHETIINILDNNKELKISNNCLNKEALLYGELSDIINKFTQ